jgi:hypothetical protein
MVDGHNIMGRQFNIKQLPTGSYSISGSFSGSFQGDGSNLSNVFPPLSSSHLFIGNSSNVATAVTASGDISVNDIGIFTIQPDSVTYDKIQDVSQKAVLGSTNPSGSTVEEIPVVESYLPTNSVTVLLETAANWDINGNYIGTAITGTFQGQNHYNANYWYTAVDDNVWIRLIRG